MVRTMDAGDTLVARDGFDTWSDADMPVAGDLTGIDYEVLLRVNPTHILIQPSAAGLPSRLQTMASEHRWTLKLLPTLTLEDVEDSAARVADLVDGEDALRTWQAAWRRSLEPIAHASSERPLVLLSTDPPAALGPGSVHHTMLERLGTSPHPSTGAAYQRLSLEDIIALDPTCLVLLAPDEASRDIEALLGPLTRLDIRAVREERVVVVRDSMALIPSTSLIDTAHELRRGFAALTEGG